MTFPTPPWTDGQVHTEDGHRLQYVAAINTWQSSTVDPDHSELFSRLDGGTKTNVTVTQQPPDAQGWLVRVDDQSTDWGSLSVPLADDNDTGGFDLTFTVAKKTATQSALFDVREGLVGDGFRVTLDLVTGNAAIAGYNITPPLVSSSDLGYAWQVTVSHIEPIAGSKNLIIYPSSASGANSTGHIDLYDVRLAAHVEQTDLYERLLPSATTTVSVEQRPYDAMGAPVRLIENSTGLGNIVISLPIDASAGGQLAFTVAKSHTGAGLLDISNASNDSSRVAFEGSTGAVRGSTVAGGVMPLVSSVDVGSAYQFLVQWPAGTTLDRLSIFPDVAAANGSANAAFDASRTGGFIDLYALEFESSGTFPGTVTAPDIEINSTVARFRSFETDGPTDQRRWQEQNTAGEYRWIAQQDDFTESNIPLRLYHSGGGSLVQSAPTDPGAGRLAADAFVENGVQLSAAYAPLNDVVLQSAGGTFDANIAVSIPTGSGVADLSVISDTPRLLLFDRLSTAGQRRFALQAANDRLLLQNRQDDATFISNGLQMGHGAGVAIGDPTGAIPATRGHLNAVALFQQNVPVATTSDHRHKTNFKRFRGGLSDLRRLRGYLKTWEWVDPEYHHGEPAEGIPAQGLEAAGLGQLVITVNEGQDDEVKRIDKAYMPLIARLINAVFELDKRISRIEDD